VFTVRSLQFISAQSCFEMLKITYDDPVVFADQVRLWVTWGATLNSSCVDLNTSTESLNFSKTLWRRTRCWTVIQVSLNLICVGLLCSYLSKVTEVLLSVNQMCDVTIWSVFGLPYKHAALYWVA